MSKYVYLFLGVGIAIILSVYPTWYLLSHNRQALSVDPTPTATLQPTPNTFHIVLVPGHDTDSGGAQFKDIYERDLAVDVAQDIGDLLKSDSRFSVLIARDKQQWNEPLASYFINEQSDIVAFKNQHQAAQKALIASGQIKVVPDEASHTAASQKTSIELYGINKWADENDVDLIIHIHFNDSGRPNMSLPGSNHGFDMFIPESQLPNSGPSQTIAGYIFQELKKDFTPETGAPIGDQSLIAIGASETLNKPSMLIEYAYIYEKQIANPATRADYLKLMAQQTVAGIDDYLASKDYK